jgi:hypothetical protein
MTFNQARPEATENLVKRMSYVPDVKKRPLNPHYIKNPGPSQNAEDFLSGYMQRKAVRDTLEDQVDKNAQLHLDSDRIVRHLNRDNKDIQSIPRAKDPIQPPNVKRQSLISDMLETYGASSTNIGKGATRSSATKTSTSNTYVAKSKPTQPAKPEMKIVENTVNYQSST